MKFLEANALAITAVVAVFALIQPWIFAAWRKYFRQGSIEIYQTGNLEIGYSVAGPTIGMYGTLRCVHQDLFVDTMQLELVKQKDSSRHCFEWGVFRSEKITIGRERQATLEPPYGFMLSTSLPRPLNIQFHERQIQSEMRPIINRVSEEWWKVVNDSLGGEQFRRLIDSAPPPQDLLESLSRLYEEFRRGTVFTESYASLFRMCYWDEGKYSLKLRVHTSKPECSFEKSWDFTLSKEEVDRIQLNLLKVLHDTCGRPSYGEYWFAYPKYESK